MKRIILLFLYFLSITSFSQNSIGYFIDKEDNKFEIFNKDSENKAFYNYTNLLTYDSNGKSYRIGDTNLKEIKINNDFFHGYNFYRNEKRMRKGKKGYGFGQLVLSDSNYSLYYSVSSNFVHKGPPSGWFTIINNQNNLLLEEFAFSKSYLVSRVKKTKEKIYKYFGDCDEKFIHEFNARLDKVKFLSSMQLVFRDFGVYNCK